jgi:hypothetical protein
VTLDAPYAPDSAGCMLIRVSHLSRCEREVCILQRETVFHKSTESARSGLWAHSVASSTRLLWSSSRYSECSSSSSSSARSARFRRVRSFWSLSRNALRYAWRALEVARKAHNVPLLLSLAKMRRQVPSSVAMSHHLPAKHSLVTRIGTLPSALLPIFNRFSKASHRPAASRRQPTDGLHIQLEQNYRKEVVH